MNGRITHRSGRELKVRMHLFDDIFPVIRVEGRLLTCYTKNCLSDSE